MIKPIYAQMKSQHGRIGYKLWEPLIWWKTVLSLGIAEAIPWHNELSTPVHLFVDAASTPPRCAAVLVVDGVYHYTDVRPPMHWFVCLNERNDNQIMSLEIAAIRVALCTFVNEVAGRKVILYSDNVGMCRLPCIRVCNSCILSCTQAPRRPRLKVQRRHLTIMT